MLVILILSNFNQICTYYLYVIDEKKKKEVPIARFYELAYNIASHHPCTSTIRNYNRAAICDGGKNKNNFRRLRCFIVDWAYGVCIHNGGKFSHTHLGHEALSNLPAYRQFRHISNPGLQRVLHSFRTEPSSSYCTLALQSSAL